MDEWTKIKVDEEKLALYLQKWFHQSNLLADNFWNRNKVGKIIRENLKTIGKWRNRARGNPKEGYKKMKEAEKEQEEKENSNF